MGLWQVTPDCDYRETYVKPVEVFTMKGQRNTVFFVHIARNAGVRFSNLMIGLLRRSCSDCNVFFDRFKDAVTVRCSPPPLCGCNEETRVLRVGIRDRVVFAVLAITSVDSSASCVSFCS